MVYNSVCDIYALRVIRKNHEDIPEKVLVRQGVPCVVSLSDEYRDINASRLEQMGNFVISLPAGEMVEVGYEIHSEGRKMIVESVKVRKFASSARVGSIKVFAKLV